MKKIYFIAFLFTIFLWINSSAQASIIWNVQVKKSTSLDSTFTSNLTWVDLNSYVNFRILISNSAIGNYWWSVSLPTWFILSWNVVIWSKNTCSTNINSSSNNWINYSFSSMWWNCKVEIFATYQTTSAWTKTITSTYNDWSTIYTFDNIFIWVSNFITALSANSVDYDKDWFIDWMRILFDKNITIWNIDLNKYTLSYMWINATNMAISWVVNNELYLRFDDWIWDSWIVPDLIIDWYTKDSWNITFNNILSSSIIETDWASPVLRQINNTLIVNNVGWIINTVANSNSSWNIVLDFSESIKTSSINWLMFSYNWLDSITGSISFQNSNKRIIFQPLQNLTWDFRIVINNILKDNSSNQNSARILDYLVKIIDNVSPIWANINWTIWISINSWSIETITRFVNLNIKAYDGFALSWMMISNLSNFSWSNWINYNENIYNWNITDNSTWTWTKTVYIKFIDTSNNISNTYSDNIIYNPPQDYIDFNFSSPLYINTNTIILSWWCSYDSLDNSLILEYKYNLWDWLQWPVCNNVSNSWSREFDDYSYNSINNIYLRFKNYTDIINEFMIIHDNINPTWILKVNNDEIYTNDPNNYLQLLLTWNDNFGIYTFELSWDLKQDYIWRFLFTDSNVIVEWTHWEGTKMINVKYYDRAWNESVSYIKNIIIDKTNPTWSIIIEWWNSYSKNYDVEISLTYWDNYEVWNIMISEDINFTWENWILPQWTINFTLSNWNWTKTVFYKVKDKAWNVSSIYQDSIIIDTEKPQSSINQWSWTFENNSNINIILTCNDNWPSWCKNIYYREWTSWNFNIYTWSFSIIWSNISKSLFYYSEDNAWNIGDINNVTYTFTSSYINISTIVPSFTNQESIIITWNCNNVSWNQYIEFNVNNNTRTWWIECLWNSRTSNISLIDNTLNTITYRFIQNTSITKQISITQDKIGPSNVDLSINNNNWYSSSTTVTLYITWFDSNWIHTMLISWDIINTIFTWFTNNISVVLTSWEWSKSIYIILQDKSWNESNMINKSIILDQTLPIVNISPNWWIFTSNQQVSITMNEWWIIYYSFNSLDDLTTQWLIYNWSFTINDSKVVYYQWVDFAGNISIRKSASFNKYTQPNDGGGWWWGIIYEPIIKPKPVEKPISTWTNLVDDLNKDDIFKIVYEVWKESQIQIFEKLLSRLIGILWDVNNLPSIWTSLDNKRLNYYRYISWFFVNIFKYKNLSDKKYQTIGKDYLNKLLKEEKEIWKLFNWLFYFEKWFLYPKDSNYNKLFVLIQNKLFKKYYKLLLNKTITQNEYNQLIDKYNNFVYSIIMYKYDKNKSLQLYAKEEIKVILNYYKLK